MLLIECPCINLNFYSVTISSGELSYTSNSTSLPVEYTLMIPYSIIGIRTSYSYYDAEISNGSSVILMIPLPISLMFPIDSNYRYPELLHLGLLILP